MTGLLTIGRIRERLFLIQLHLTLLVLLLGLLLGPYYSLHFFELRCLRVLEVLDQLFCAFFDFA
jgi:hypothetical protein